MRACPHAQEGRRCLADHMPKPEGTRPERARESGDAAANTN